MDDNFLSTTVILPAKNVGETANFYQEKLGFEIRGIWDDPAYGSVTRGGVVIEFGEGRQNHAGSGVCQIHVKDVDRIYREYQTAGLDFVGDLADRKYGNRDFRVKDNNGNMLIISSFRFKCPGSLSKG